MSTEHQSTSTTEQLDDGAVLAVLETERLALCDHLEELEPSEWSIPSLCAGWTVQDVVAHLTLSTRESAMDFVRGMLRYRANFDRMAKDRAKQRAGDYAPAELVGQIRSTAGSATTSFGSSLRDSLIDVIVHTQDIARPLNSDWDPSPEHVAIALDHAVSSRWYGAKKRLAHATLQATDIDWSTGSGTSTITGPTIDLLLVATGRSVGLDNLEGSGIDELKDRFGSS